MRTEGRTPDATQQLIRDLARETLDRYREINLLYRASETIGASLDAEEVPRLLIEEAQRVIPSDDAVVLLAGDPAPDAWSSDAPLIASVLDSGRPDYTDSALCVPLRAGDKVLGVALLARDVGRPSFTAGDEKLFLGLGSQAGVALERARLHLQETRRLQLEEELAVARRIQLSLLPSRVPIVPGWRFGAAYQAAREVGGDFYDFLDHDLSAGRLGLVIADVTGKGVPAALMMAHSRAVLRAESLAGSSPVEILANTNRQFMAERQSRLFLSAFVAQLDLVDGRLTYASAGHDAPLWVSAGGAHVRELEAPGVILGAFDDMGLEQRSIDLAPGDVVVFFTDGVTEARNHDRELFGDERLAAVASAAVAHGKATAASVLESVIMAVGDFTAGAEQADDLTIVVVQREG